MSSFTINGVRKEYLKIRSNFQRVVFAPISRQIINIPNRPGGYQGRMETDVRVIDVPVDIIAKTKEEQYALEEDLAEFLIYKEPREVIFDFDKSRSYFAVVNGDLDVTDIATKSRGTITFVCYEPYKYGEEVIAEFVDGVAVINNKGTVNAQPVFELTAVEPVTNVDLIKDDDYLRIGRPVDLVNESAVDRQTTLLNSALNNLTPWSTAPRVESGEITGQMTTNGYSFQAGNFGTGTSWHGPAVQRNIPQAPIQDFIVQVQLNMYTPQVDSTGKIVVELIGEDGSIIGRMNMNRRFVGAQGNEGVVRVGNNITGRPLIETTGSIPTAWKEFSGVLRLSRIGNVWEAYIAQVNPKTKAHHTRSFYRFTDVMDLYTGAETGKKLVAVRLQIARLGTRPSSPMSIGHLSVARVNAKTTEGPEVIARQGDLIKIDHRDLREDPETSPITINGEDAYNLKDFPSNLFDLPKGDSVIVLSPGDKLEGFVKFRERYL